jgi:hypothetical protein
MTGLAELSRYAQNKIEKRSERKARKSGLEKIISGTVDINYKLLSTRPCAQKKAML